MNTTLESVTDRIRERSKDERAAYLARIDQAKRDGRYRSALSCGNLAHGFAACGGEAKAGLRSKAASNVAIVSSSMTCCQLISLSSAFPISFGRPLTRQVAWRNLRVACRPCVMG